MFSKIADVFFIYSVSEILFCIKQALVLEWSRTYSTKEFCSRAPEEVWNTFLLALIVCQSFCWNIM